MASSNLTKIYAVVNEKGEVLGTGRVGAVRIGAGRELEIGILAGPGQKVHEVEEEMFKGDVAALHRHVRGLVSAKG